MFFSKGQLVGQLISPFGLRQTVTFHVGNSMVKVQRQKEPARCKMRLEAWRRGHGSMGLATEKIHRGQWLKRKLWIPG